MLTPREKSPPPEAQRMIEPCDAASHRTAQHNYEEDLNKIISVFVLTSGFLNSLGLMQRTKKG